MMFEINPFWIAASIEMNKEQNKTNDIELVVTTN